MYLKNLLIIFQNKTATCSFFIKTKEQSFKTPLTHGRRRSVARHCHYTEKAVAYDCGQLGRLGPEETDISLAIPTYFTKRDLLC